MSDEGGPGGSEGRGGRRVTAFEPAPRGMVPTHAGTVSDTRTVRALASAGDGWVNKDGRVLTRGSCDRHQALLSFADTAVIVADHARTAADIEKLRSDVYRRRLERHLSSGQDRGSFHFSNGSFERDHELPSLDEMLGDEGWTRVQLRRIDGVKYIATPSYQDRFIDYRDTLVSLARTLGCRVGRGGVEGRLDLMYDPAYVAPEGRMQMFGEHGDIIETRSPDPAWWDGDGYGDIEGDDFGPGT